MNFREKMGLSGFTKDIVTGGRELGEGKFLCLRSYVKNFLNQALYKAALK